MAWRPVDIGQLLESIGYIISFDFMKKLTKNTFAFITNWMGRVAKAKREGVNKRLRRHRRRLDTCKTIKKGPCKCNCVKCSSYRYVQRKRVLEPDYLANLAYEHRMNQEKPMMDEENGPKSPELDEPSHGKRQDHRDLRDSEYNGVVWWTTSVNHRVQMPPLLNELPTRSNCSSTSGFRSGTPDILDSSEPSINTYSSFDSSCYQSCRASSSSPVHVNISSKSESRMRDMEIEKIRVACPLRSASMPLGPAPDNQWVALLASKFTGKSNKRKKRPVSTKTTTSHACDSLSTCVKCSRIISRPCKRMTR